MTENSSPATLSDAEWRARLSPERYAILRQKATEPAFTGAYVQNHETGAYHCAGCGAQLFRSDTKFDSGSGWPSFTEPADLEAVDFHVDRSHGMSRPRWSAALRGPPGPRLRRRPRSRRQALLHQLRRARDDPREVMDVPARRPGSRGGAAPEKAAPGPRGPLVRPIRPEECEEAGRATRAGFVALFGEEEGEYLEMIADVAGRCDRTTVLVAVADGGRSSARSPWS